MTFNSSKYLGFFLAISVSYSMLWYHSWYLPLNFAVIDNTASWFLPAGYRLAAFLFVPRKYWLAIIVGEWCAIRLITAERGEIPLLSDIIATVFPALVYLGAAHIYLKMYDKPSFKTTRQSIALLVGSVISATLTSAILTTSMIYHGEVSTISSNELFSHKHLLNIVSFALGDIIGVLLILPPVILLAEYFQREKTSNRQFGIPSVFQILLALGLTLIVLTNLHQVPLYYVKILTVILVIASTHRWGWKGAVLSVLLMCILIVYTSLLSTEIISVIENQIYLISIAFTSLILGASISEQSSLNQQLVKQNSALNHLNNRYKQQAEKNQLLAAKVVDIQERERKKISNELHDDIGQTLTAMKTEITILEHITSDNKVRHSASNLRVLSNKVYNVTRNLIMLLHPRELDDLGLEKALRSKVLTQLLSLAKVNYHLNIESDLSVLSEEKKIAVYRIVQESFNNIVKHANAKNVYVDLAIEQQQLKLSIRDDGTGFDVQNKALWSGRFGLFGIEERAVALNGHFQIGSSLEGTKIQIQIPTI